MRQRLLRAFIVLVSTVALASAHPVAPPTGSTRSLPVLTTGALVSFVRGAAPGWGITIVGGSTPRVSQPAPIAIELSGPDGAVRQLTASYTTIRQVGTTIEANADVRSGDAVFQVADRWQASGAVLTLRRTITIVGRTNEGFASSIVFDVDPSVTWPDVQYLAPGALYGDPTYDGERSAGGTLNYAARQFLMREDLLPAPLFGLSFANGASLAILDSAPNGDTTVEESKLTQPVMTDGRFRFGTLGARQTDDSPLTFGFWYPGSMSSLGRGDATPVRRWFRRYHPVAPDTVHQYQVSVRFGRDESFRDLTRQAWRWAWATLKPAVTPIDVDLMRRVLTDHMVAQARTIDGRTAIPFVLSTQTEVLQWNWTMVAMGFVGKNLECANQLLRESDRDSSARGQRMREVGLGIIASLIRALPTVPLPATGYDLATGKPHDHTWLAPWLRNASEDMRALIDAYRRERAHGRTHPEWLAWVKQYADWLIQQQRADGSFPRRWKAGSHEVEEPSGTTSYSPVPLLVMMSDETGDPRYRQSGIRAADYVWSTWGTRGLFVGGASDAPNVTDKEAGMLSLEAFLTLYESTHDTKWLARAKAAADFAESWMWIWNLPMPLDADNAQLHWKTGVPTVGLQGITAQGAGGVDEYLDWSVPSFARLAKYTGDPHYLDVARILLHNTKAMVAMPGRLYDLKGPGWQQEHWRLGPGGAGRGVGGHRFWLPWVSANHLRGITGLEDFDAAVFKALASQ